MQRVGLTRNEAKVYLAVLRSGSISAGRIAEESGIHRRNAYDAAEKLAGKGLIGFVLRGKVKCFQITSPQRLLEMARERRKVSEACEKDLESLMPDIMLMNGSREGSQDVCILKGRESRKLVFEDILNSRENRCLGGHTPSKLSMNYVKQWHRRRVEAGIKDMVIYNRKDPFSGFLRKLKHTEVRLMQRPVDSKTVFNIYDGKVAIFFWINEQPFTIWISNQKVANDFRGYFDFMWEKAKKC